MATITASLFSALDGVVDPMVGDWHFPYFNEEMGKAVDGTHDADVMLFGRVTYDSFAGAWPEREAAGEEDAEGVVEDVWAHGQQESIREDLRLRAALDRLAAEVKPIAPELADAREKLWTPDKETSAGGAKLWTPGSKESE